MDIIVENLTKKYGVQKAVDDVSFTVRNGEVLGLLGPNGAGKTTVMKAITNYFAPTAGRITIGNISVIEHPEEVKKHIGYLPEANPLYYDMPVIEYLQFVAELHAIEKSKIKERILEMIQVCGLQKEKHKKIGELSKGYKQRVGLAQAMIHNPDVLVLDEPTEGLDPNQIVEIRELIKRIGREKTVILSSHILAEVEATCDRIMIINNGKIVADGTAESLRKQSQGKEILVVGIEEGDKNEIFEALKQLDTVEMVDFSDRKGGSVFEVQSKADMSSRKAIFQLCVNRGWYLAELTPVETKLEDIFRQLTKN
jgi:ABC-2 type transport system ATP-binding protein